MSANGSFSFSTPMQSGGTFAVTVKTQPTGPTQTCSVSQGSGTVATGNVTTVMVVCATQTYPVGGSVAGLAGSGLVLQDNLGDNFAIAADGPFTFATPVASGGMYSVTVLTQPSSPAQTCTVAAGSGLIPDAAVTNVAITCATNHYKVGGTVIGLMGSGLTLRNGGGDDLAITASGAFQFATSALSGATFAVTIAAQPTNPAQTCTMSGATGAVGGADVTSVTVNCSTNQHVVGGTVSGLAGAGLKLALNGGTPFAVGASGGFAFPSVLPSGATYQVTITDQPTTPWQTCVINSGTGTGTIADADIASVAVACTTNSYKIRGTVGGLTGAGLVLRNNGGDDLAVLADGTFAFATAVASGGGYAVTVAAQPTTPWQTCTVDSGSGGVAGGDVSNVMVTCTTNDYAVGGTVTGLAGTVVLQNNAGDSLILTANGGFSFPTARHQRRLLPGDRVDPADHAVPDLRGQHGHGTVTSAAITDVSVTCVTNTYTVGGTIIGLTGSNFVLQNNAGDDLVLGPTGSFTFATAIDSGTQLRRHDQDAAVGPDPDLQRRRRHGDGRQRERHHGDDQLHHEFVPHRRHRHGPHRQRRRAAEQRRRRHRAGRLGDVHVRGPGLERRHVQRHRQDPADRSLADLHRRGQRGRDGDERERLRRDHLRVEPVPDLGHGQQRRRRRPGAAEQRGRQPEHPVERHVHVRDAGPKRAHLRGDGAVAAGEPLADLLGDGAGGNGRGRARRACRELRHQHVLGGRDGHRPHRHGPRAARQRRRRPQRQRRRQLHLRDAGGERCDLQRHRRDAAVVAGPELRRQQRDGHDQRVPRRRGDHLLRERRHLRRRRRGPAADAVLPSRPQDPVDRLRQLRHAGRHVRRVLHRRLPRDQQHLDCRAACIGQNSCTVNATNGVFGDPCVGTFKRLWVQASCSSGFSRRPPPPPRFGA